MKFVKREINVSDSNDKEKCHYTRADIKKYVAQLKIYASENMDKLDVWEFGRISNEIKTWNNFFKLADRVYMRKKKSKK